MREQEVAGTSQRWYHLEKIADADKVRASKLDSAWVKAVWVGRVDKSNEHSQRKCRDVEECHSQAGVNH